MITQFEDYCLWMYVAVDELWPLVAPRCRRPGPAPVCSDSELVTMVLVGESRGWDEETDLVREWRGPRGPVPPAPAGGRGWGGPVRAGAGAERVQRSSAGPGPGDQRAAPGDPAAARPGRRPPVRHRQPAGPGPAVPPGAPLVGGRA